MSRSAFWHFSLELYGQAGVADLCLALQDDAGADVSVLLYMLFLAEQQRALDARALAAILQLVRPWNEAVVIPLRRMRRALRHDLGRFDTARSAPLRTEVKRLELAAEQLLQETLAAELPASAAGRTAADRAGAAANNLRCYAAALGLPEHGFDRLLQSYVDWLANRVPK